MSVITKELGYDQYPYDSYRYDNLVKSARTSSQVLAEIKKTIRLNSQVEFTRFKDDTPWVLYEFESRGDGDNWSATSTQPGEFSVLNLNSDIIEKYWRSATGVKESIVLVCDTKISQGIFFDTLAILGTNLTSSARLRLVASNNDQRPEEIIELKSDGSDRIIWTASDLPKASYRYFRFEIDDPTGKDDFIRIGSIIFGTAVKLENRPTDSFNVTRTEFKDEVKTLGFTTVSNSKAYTKGLKFDFKDFSLGSDDYSKITQIFSVVRTSLKALWIFDPRTPRSRNNYSVFAKLRRLPIEKHRSLGESQTDSYIDFTIELDESL